MLLARAMDVSRCVTLLQQQLTVLQLMQRRAQVRADAAECAVEFGEFDTGTRDAEKTSELCGRLLGPVFTVNMPLLDGHGFEQPTSARSRLLEPVLFLG